MHPADNGLIPEYNSLRDQNLMGYFNKKHIRRHLQKAGLITHDGMIVPEKVYRQNMAKQQHQQHVQKLLANAIREYAYKMEHHRQTDMMRKLKQMGRQKSDQVDLGGFSAVPRRMIQRQRPEPQERDIRSHSPSLYHDPIREGKVYDEERMMQYLASMNRRTIEKLTGVKFQSSASPYGLLILNNFPSRQPAPPKRCVESKQNVHAHRALKRLMPSATPAAISAKADKASKRM
ncbi:glutamate-rich protein 3-like [Protopterus annectens]|uniref:glutamate-rich protein 3-like n=1 Tax=Protopterus annectens TaxID=7888 RepID=UPI001CF933D7|nr:glutamate-rich protein 3-like [Protopterus annectens]